MPIRKGLRGGDFFSVTMPTARSEAKKNTTPSLVELASVLGSMGIHRAGEAGVSGKAPRVSKFNF
jgi:hypothetical protein